MSDLAPNDPRVRYAAERTFLAWIRTGLALMGLGFVVARFGMFLRELAVARGVEVSHSPRFSVWVGSALIVLGVAVNFASAAQHSRVLARLERGEPIDAGRWSLAMPVANLVAAIGVVLAVYLLAEAG
jgi:inner membrane protein YidH